MIVNYRLSPDAEEDLYRTWLYGIEHWGLAKADLYQKEFTQRFEEIAINPFLYPSANYIRQDYRKSVRGVDTIYYRVTNNIVEIMNIIGRQDLENL